MLLSLVCLMVCEGCSNEISLMPKPGPTYLVQDSGSSHTMRLLEPVRAKVVIAQPDHTWSAPIDAELRAGTWMFDGQLPTTKQH